MLLEAVVHPKSISRHDKLFDRKIDIAVEDLEQPSFRKKMLGLPVTMYHHDTKKAVMLIEASGAKLNGRNMKTVLNHLHFTQPSAQTLAAQKCQTQHKTSTLSKEVELMLYDHKNIIDKARGQGVLGSVTDFFRKGDEWCVNIKMDNETVHPILREQMKAGRRLGDISLTHATIDNEVVPLEISYTKQGLRNGSTISGILMASHNKHLSETNGKMEATDSAETANLERVMQFYTNLAVLDPSLKLQKTFTETVSIITASCEKNRPPAVKKELTEEEISIRAQLKEQTESIKILAEATGHCLKESGLGGVGLLRERTVEEWMRNPKDLVCASQYMMTNMATNYKKRKQDDHDFTHVLNKAGFRGAGTTLIGASLDSTSTSPALVMASNANNTANAVDQQGEEDNSFHASMIRQFRKQNAASAIY